MRNVLILLYLVSPILVRPDVTGLFGTTTPDAECEVQREDAYECGVKYADLNKDNRISYLEVVYFRNHVLKWYEKALVWAVNETPDKVMDRCGEKPHKKHITRASFEAAPHECLRHCYDWRLLMGMCDRMEKMSDEEKHEYRSGYAPWRKEQIEREKDKKR